MRARNLLSEDQRPVRNSRQAVARRPLLRDQWKALSRSGHL